MTREHGRTEANNLLSGLGGDLCGGQAGLLSSAARDGGAATS